MITYTQTPTGEDILGIIKLAEKFYTEVQFKHLKFNSQKLLNSLLKVASNPDVKFFIAKDNDNVVGVLMAVKYADIFTDDIALQEQYFFVVPEFRGNYIAYNLVKQLEEYAKASKIGTIMINQATGIDIEKVTKFYQKMGYRTRGVHAIKEL